MANDNYKGNLTTIAVYVWMIVSPYLADFLTQDQFVTFFVAVVGLVLAIVSSYYPNTFGFLDNDKGCCGYDMVLNEEYEADIDDSED